MGTALTGFLIFLALQVIFVLLLLGMARWERFADAEPVQPPSAYHGAVEADPEGEQDLDAA